MERRRTRGRLLNQMNSAASKRDHSRRDPEASLLYAAGSKEPIYAIGWKTLGLC